MKMRNPQYILTLLFIAFIGCTPGNKKSNAIPTEELSKALVDTAHLDTLILKPALNIEDTAVNEYLNDTLKPIRVNFKKLNSISKWDSITKRELWETGEGGEAKYFYLKGNAEKIITRNYGETFQQLTEYYLLNNQLSFVFDRVYKYNRPLFYDSAAMKQSDDDQVFDLTKSVLFDVRSYFKEGKLIHQINNPESEQPYTTQHLMEEQKRLKLNFDKLKKLAREY